MTIIETSSNQFFEVEEFPSHLNMAHVWKGQPVKKVKGQWVPKTQYGEPVRPCLVRKAGTRVVTEG